LQPEGLYVSGLPFNRKKTLMRKLLSICLAVACAVWFTACATSTEQKELAVEKSTVVTITATVEALDLASCMVTSKGPEGNTITFKADDRVKNLPQVKVGDQVVAKYYESVAIQVMKPGQVQAGTTGAAGTAKPGEKPGMVAAGETIITASIEAIDKEQSLVTLKGSDGNVETYRVQDPKNLENVKVGDQVVITYSVAVAISVEEVNK
jgi:Cu/Ag efflux protein CusF